MSPSPEEQHPGPGAAPPAEGTVLVVDDEPAIREVIVRALRSLGIEAIPAWSGEEAVRLFDEHRDRIGCVLLDLLMPGLDGEQTFARLTAIAPDVHARVVLMTGFPGIEARRRFEHLGRCGFLQKPFGLADLRAAVEAVLAGREEP